MSTKISSGASVRISGARSFTGIVLGAGDTILTIALDAQRIIQLRRDPASSAPDQWRYGDLPVAIAVIGRRADDFG